MSIVIGLSSLTGPAFAQSSFEEQRRAIALLKYPNMVGGARERILSHLRQSSGNYKIRLWDIVAEPEKFGIDPREFDPMNKK